MQEQIVVKMNVLKDNSEVVGYDDPHFKIYLKRAKIDYFPNRQALCHWHEEIEIIHLEKGTLDYYINGEKLIIKEGDTLFVNKNKPHYGFAKDNQDSTFLCLIFNPNILFSSRYLVEKYIEPILNDDSLNYFYIKDNKELNNNLELLHDVFNKKENNYELESLSLLNKIYGIIYTQITNNYHPTVKDPLDLEITKKMVKYIYSNYQLPITLCDIAKYASISKSYCCALFKKELKTPAIAYLNIYRIEKSCELLNQQNKSITEICYQVGFSSPSYYAKLFKKYKGISPKKFTEINK